MGGPDFFGGDKQLNNFMFSSEHETFLSYFFLDSVLLVFRDADQHLLVSIDAAMVHCKAIQYNVDPVLTKLFTGQRMVVPGSL